METRLYQTRDLNLQMIAEALVFEYRAQGYEAQNFGDANQTVVQLKKESTLRTITGLNKALTISMQRLNTGTDVKVGAQDWVDQMTVGAVGLVIHPLLVTAAIGAYQQNSLIHEILTSIDRHIRQQQPQVQFSVPPAV